MHRGGHIGVALAVYAPVAYLLVSAEQVTLATLGLVGMLVIEPLPDRDLEIPGLKHRGASHTFIGALLIGVIAAVAVVIASQTIPEYLSVSLDTSTVAALDGATLTLFTFGIAVLAVIAHLLGDVLTPMGIRPFWPISSRAVSLNLWTASNPLANPLLFMLGVGALTSAVWFGLGLGLSAPSDVTVESVFQAVVQKVLR